MKKQSILTTIVAIIAVAAIALCAVFGGQKADLQKTADELTAKVESLETEITDLKTAAEEAAKAAEEAAAKAAEEAAKAAEEAAAKAAEEAAKAAEEAAAEAAEEATEPTSMSVAMITDYGDITDQSFNQTTYEACKAFCEENNIQFAYYKPTGDSTAERVAMIEAAINDGYTTIVMPGYAFAGAIVEVAEEYQDINFIALDVALGDLLENAVGADYDYNPDNWNLADYIDLSKNVYCAVYQEELCGYMAGYAAVKLGYKHLGFLGGMAVPAVIRYGYGFVQGANAAAEDKSAVTVEYAYGNQFFGDADITAYMDTWYQGGVEVVFACGGGIFTSACEAAQKVEGGKIIGVDVDQSGVITSLYGDATLTVTSAMKGLAQTVDKMLNVVKDGKFGEYAGLIENLGLVSEDPAQNYVGIPETTQYSDAFTANDYKAMVADMFNGVITVSNDITAAPAVEITVNYQGNIK